MSVAVPLLKRVVDWYCPACGVTDQTMEDRPHTRMHICPRQRFLTAPMVLAGTKAKVEIREREDYIGNEDAPVDGEGRQGHMSIVVTRDNGQDAVVYAPTARASVR